MSGHGYHGRVHLLHLVGGDEMKSKLIGRKRDKEGGEGERKTSFSRLVRSSSAFAAVAAAEACVRAERIFGERKEGIEQGGVQHFR